MDQIMIASGDLISSNESGQMVRQARILAQATAELIQVCILLLVEKFRQYFLNQPLKIQ